MPIRLGDGTTVIPNGIKEVRTGDGDVIYSSGAVPSPVTDVTAVYAPPTPTGFTGTYIDL